MIPAGLRESTQGLTSRSGILVVALILGNLFFNILANTGFKLSANSASWRGFLAWQVVGNLSGFIAVLNLTGAMRFIPLHVAYPISAGLTVIGVQLFAARLLLHEAVTPAQWLGTLFVVVGIVLIGGR
jgi:multidrug transporter EmrE-like cation transporter